jgi:DNA-binding transcriptional LysR family regulator
MRDMGISWIRGARSIPRPCPEDAAHHRDQQWSALTVDRCIQCNNPMDRLDAMRVFVAVADLRGFAPAARQLSLSPSAVTRMIGALEERLGARLLQRTTRSVALTDAGARFLVRARRILADVAEAEGAAQAERTVPAGRLVVAAPNVFGRLHVAPTMCRYLAKYPEVRGELTLADRMASLIDDGIDVAVRIGVLDDSSLIARPVGATRRVVVGAPRYLARHRKPRVPEDLTQHALIQFTALASTPEWRFTREAGEQRVAFAPVFATNSADAAIGHAELGGGLTMVLAYQVAESVRAKRLQVVLADAEPPPLPIQLVYPSTRLLSAKVRTFVELVTKTCDWRFVEL